MKPVQIPSFMSIGTTVIELREFKEKKKKRTWTKWEKILALEEVVFLVTYFIYTQFCFDMFYAVK